jgi:cell division protein FtsZ
MAEMGMALMGTGIASGDNRAVEAAQKAISSPLLEDITIAGARGVLVNVTGGPDLTLYEVSEATSLIQEEAHEDANIFFGAVIDETLRDEVRVTVIATGFSKADEKPERLMEPVVSIEAERALANFPRKEREAPAYLRPEPPLPLEEKPARPLRRRIWTPRPEEEYDRPAFLRKQAD